MRTKPEIYMSAATDAAPNYRSALELAGAVCTEDIEEADGLLIPGGIDIDPALYGRENIDCRGVDRGRDIKELYAALRFLAAKKPVLGICRGSQLLAAVMGGTLNQNIEGHAPLSEDETCLHPTRCALWMADLYGKNCVVNSSHHQSVDRLPDGCEPLQWAEDGILEAYCHKTLPVIAVQWHPERLCGSFARPDAADGLKIFRRFVSLCKTRE